VTHGGKKALHLNGWSRLPRSFPTYPLLGMNEMEGQLTFILHDVYRARRRPQISTREEMRNRMKTQGRLLYCNETDRWKIYEAYAKPATVQCGESFELKVGAHFLPCRIEQDHEWVVHFSNTRFHLHPEVSYWIRVE
jgi:hypothetical protein